MSLDLARQFKSIGWEVHVADSFSAKICMYSNSVDQFHFLPKLNSNVFYFINEINELTDKYRIGILLPTCEEIFAISKFRYLLSKMLDFVGLFTLFV